MKTIYLVVEKNLENGNKAIIAVAKNKQVGRRFVAERYRSKVVYYPSKNTYYSSDFGVAITINRFRGINLTHRSI